MIRRMCAVALASVALAMPAAAQTQTLINEDFSGWPVALNVTSAPSGSPWAVYGNVDIVANGTHGITCASNNCLDLDGSARTAGNLESQLFQFYAGDVLRFQFDVSGSQRTADGLDTFYAYLYSTGSLSISSLESRSDGAVYYSPSETFGGGFALAPELNNGLLASTYPWTTWYVQFTLEHDAEIGVGFLTFSADNVGPLVDNVLLTRTAATTVPEPSTYMLMAAGLAAMAAVARRRRNV